MATVKDVAKRAGVSVATVSRVLTNYPHVAVATRKRVLQAVEALNYRPDQVARSLRRRKSNLIGLVVSTIENVFFTEVAHAAEQAARDNGYNLIVCNTDENPAQEATYVELLSNQLIAGIVLAPALGDTKHLEPLVQNGLPIVLINRRLEHLPCASIVSNDAEISFACMRHLFQQGYRRIAAITGLPRVHTTVERLKGYRQALVKAGLKPDPTLEVSGNATMQGGYAAARALLQRKDRPDALFAFNNVMTQGAVAALQEMGLTWPDQIGVTGFGAFKTGALYRPPLTLIHQPTREMGRRAIEMLVHQIENPSAREPVRVVLENRLVLSNAALTLGSHAHHNSTDSS